MKNKKINICSKEDTEKGHKLFLEFIARLEELDNGPGVSALLMFSVNLIGNTLDNGTKKKDLELAREILDGIKSAVLTGLTEQGWE